MKSTRSLFSRSRLSHKDRKRANNRRNLSGAMFETLEPRMLLATTTVGSFTGGDVGEGLDLDGKFIYAVNAGGPAVGKIRDADFTNEAAAGSPITANETLANWWSPDTVPLVTTTHLEP